MKHSDAQIVQEVEAMVLMMENGEWAEHCASSDLGQRLEECITQLHNDLAEAHDNGE